MNNFKKMLKGWVQIENERISLQRIYIAVAFALLFAAGMISLINHELGIKIFFASIAVVGVFALNAVSWVLGHAILASILNQNQASSQKTIKKTSKK